MAFHDPGDCRGVVAFRVQLHRVAINGMGDGLMGMVMTGAPGADAWKRVAC